MKNIWVLSVKTSLPSPCESKEDLELTISAYDSFDKARAALRKLLKGYAFTKNSMFDGDGHMTYFMEHIKDCLSEEEEGDLDETYLSRERLGYMADCLRSALAGEDVLFSLSEEQYDDNCYLSAECGEGCLSIVGDFEGPCNGIDPFIFTNIFSMVAEKDYYLYLDDLFGQDYSSELYIDLKKCELQ